MCFRATKQVTDDLRERMQRYRKRKFYKVVTANRKPSMYKRGVPYLNGTVVHAHLTKKPVVRGRTMTSGIYVYCSRKGAKTSWMIEPWNYDGPKHQVITVEAQPEDLIGSGFDGSDQVACFNKVTVVS